MKIDRHGRAKILTTEEIQLLFNEGFTLNPNRDRTLFAVCLYTACRINECVTLKIQDVYDSRKRVRPILMIRKGNTKGKLATRTIPVIEDLRIRLDQFKPPTTRGYLFPGRHGKNHLNSGSADWILREACKRVGIEGVSTHSFRRTALTQMSNAGVPLRIIQEISGHRTLDELYKYLEVQPEQVKGAIANLSMLTPVEEEIYLKKSMYHPVKETVTRKAFGQN
ncbi:Integrase [Hyella patelloides LEGE 07179]|uniref:Integrase n=1 Tax=Hyella patelloides LEGE 07179 TaxID=945734 RepID=A0A563VN20_9CYAN|nr:site-specific integrase [Hyella patelloides]VEP12850.1 Integrase [Hyella patelloides LEGE 07179]